MKTTNKSPAAAGAKDLVDISLDEQTAPPLSASETAASAAGDLAPALLPSTPRVLKLDPNNVWEGDGPNRDKSAFESAEFEQLGVSILEMGGNTQPIDVRRVTAADRLPPGIACEYVLVSGARRLRACKRHRLQVLAMVSEEFTPLDASLRRLAENFNRQSLCALELGWQVQFIREQHADAKLSDAAIGRMIGADKSVVSKALTLASLPRQIIDCFESVEQVQYNAAKPLKDAFSAAPAAVLAAAGQICSGPRPKAAEVLQRLTQAAAEAKGGDTTGRKKTGVESFNTRLEVDGQAVGEMAQNKAGKWVITLENPLSDGQREALGRHVASFVRQRVMGLKAPKGATKAGKRTAAAPGAQVAEGASS